MLRPAIEPQARASAATHSGVTRHVIAVKRAGDPPAPADGTRVLVVRHWPPGLSKERAAIDLWLADVAPSIALCRWYARDLQRWDEFGARYRAELAHKDEVLRLLDGLRRTCQLTLIHGARDAAHNSAIVLRDALQLDHP